MKNSVILIVFILLLSRCSGVLVTERPPDQRIVVIPAAPGAGFVWVNDSWKWNHHSHEYQASKGRWVKPRRNSAVWVEGYWVQTRRGWKYIDGHWRY